jgi:hypothetical protein
LDLNTLLILYPTLLIIQLLNFIWLQRFYIDPKTESGFHIYGKLLNIAIWPIYFLSFIGAVLGKKLSYQVTPKGSAQNSNLPPSNMLFRAHLVLGTITAVGIFAGFVTGNNAPQIMFWAFMNTFFMYLFAFWAIVKNLLYKEKKLFSPFSYNLSTKRF